jgi:hypothetical protein
VTRRWSPFVINMSPATRRLVVANRRVPFAHKSNLRNTLSDLCESLLWFEDGQLRILTGRSATVPRRDEILPRRDELLPRRDEIFLRVLPQLLRSCPSLESYQSLLRIVSR